MTTKDQEKLRAKKHRYYEKHKDEIRVKKQKYYHANKEQVRDAQKSYASKNAEQIAKKKHAVYLANQEERKARQRWLGLKSLYGITQDDYNKMFESQKGCCALCGRHQSELKSNLCVDHDHATGEVRGLLCRSCNVAIAHFQEDIGVIQRAINYLTRKHHG